MRFSVLTLFPPVVPRYYLIILVPCPQSKKDGVLQLCLLLPMGLDFLVIGGTDVRKESNTEGEGKQTKNEVTNRIGSFFVILGRQVEIADFLHYCLAPMEITSQVVARRKQFSDCDKNCPFKICHNPFNSGKGHDILNKIFEHRYIVNSSSSRHTTEKKRHLL
ncbi:hypothetical protein OUZ56_005863 [Daphnia magna]|uniref:Uncharacterized protein n=1 Tax=Daphnia magna TaxID=35525 RepID=A0ABQ9YU11_9CRUS|nr:hypothetical protein OUZ56_005863 [Daphnia magna]